MKSPTELKKKIKKNEFRCEACGEIYGKAWSDEEANKEADAIWTKEERATPQAVICDDCFQKGMNKHFRYRN